jgi:hypothetical protein
MNNIILVDDDSQFVTTFVNEAGAKNITVSPKSSLEGLKHLLPALAHKYAAVVLDIKCLITDNQSKENASFIGAALKYIDTTTPGFPRFILTGDDSEFNNLKRYYPDEKMYLKTPGDQVKLLSELDYCVKNAVSIKLKRENTAVFDTFDRGLLNPAKEATLLRVLKKYDETNSANFRGIIGDIRDIHEEIYKSINTRNKIVVPDIYINGNGSPKFSGAFYKHLEGNIDHNNNYTPTTTVFQDSTILSMTKFVHQACSEFLHGNSKINYSINPYAIKALSNSLMEMIIWSKQY